MAVDMNVAKTAYATAKSMGASSKVILALFEAGLVESGMRNLDYGDRDSVGFLQQRPSQGWSDPRNVATATRSFVSRAMAKEHSYSTAGRLAQAVQVSAFPSRYDAMQGRAQLLVSQVAGTTSPLSGQTTAVATATPVGLLSDASSIVKVFQTLADPHTWLRIAMVLAGGGAMIIGIVMIGKDVPAVRDAVSETGKLGKTATEAAAVVAK